MLPGTQLRQGRGSSSPCAHTSTMYTYEHTNTHVHLHIGTHIWEHTASSRDLLETLSGIQIISLCVAHGGGGDRVVLSPSALQRPPPILGDRQLGHPGSLSFLAPRPPRLSRVAKGS